LKLKKPLRKEDAMQRQQRLTKLAQAGDKAKQELGIQEKPDKEDVNSHKWKGKM
jgi:hypothetical protein